MFVYEGKKTVGSTEVEVLNIVFGASNVPTITPDVQVWEDTSGIHALIGANQIDGTVSE